MKRSGFLERKTSLKSRTPLRKKSKSPKKKLEDKLWDLCKQITRKLYPNVCYTCDKGGLEGWNWQTGHMWPKASLSNHLKYDLRVLRPQCFHCNINLGGMGAEYYRRMLLEIGIEEMAKLESEKNITIDADTQWFEKKVLDYQLILERL